MTPDLHDVDDEEWAALLARLLAALPSPAPHRHPSSRDGNRRMRVQIDSALCQGHGRCYDLAPDLFGDDEDGYATLTERRRRPCPRVRGRRAARGGQLPRAAISPRGGLT